MAKSQLGISTTTRQMLRFYRRRLKKSLGQHLLVNEQVLKEIVQACELQPATTVIEVGAGIGNLTRWLAQKAAKVLAIELDQNFQPFHQKYLSQLHNVQFIYHDVLKLDLSTLLKKHYEDLVITGNIPFSITSPLLMQLLRSSINWRRMVLTIQREVAERIVSPPGSRRYSILTIKTQFFSQPQLQFIIQRHFFQPQPKVEAAVVSFSPDIKYPDISLIERSGLFRLVELSFSQRRKMLKNVLRHSVLQVKKECVEEFLLQHGLSPEARPEQLSLEAFYQLFCWLKKEGYTL